MGSLSRAVIAGLLVADSLQFFVPSASPSPAEVRQVGSDFNGDGFPDLAVAAPFESFPPDFQRHLAGGVNIIYGTAAGLASTGNQFWSQDSPGIAEEALEGDRFGSSLAVADFNGDGFADLAVGVPYEEVETIDSAGGVNVLYGSADGLTAAGNQFWSQDSPGIAAAAEPDDAFGSALAAADLNGDGFADLAVGAAGEDIGSVRNAGGVNVIYGSAEGLTSAGNQFWSQDSPGIAGAAEQRDVFGSALAAADLGGSRHADLAISVSGEAIGPLNGAGALNILYGSASGLSSTRNQFWSQDTPGIAGASEGGDAFGYSLVAADLGKSGHADLAIGIPYEDIGSVLDAGGVSILYGSPTGPIAAGNQFWSQDSTDIAGAAEQSDLFGSALTAANLGISTHADLAVGVQGEAIGPVPGAGAVNVLYGAAGGVTTTGNQFWSQDSTGIADAAEEQDLFGHALASADFGNDGFSDLAVGVPDEDSATASNNGAVNAIYGSAGGLRSSGNQLWSQDSPDIADTAESLDYFGAAVTATD
jgi:hypothetical protein